MSPPYLVIFVLLALLAVAAWMYRRVREEFRKMESDDPEVWEPEIARFEAEDGRTPPPRDAILFVGSSSIRFWRHLAEDMAPLTVIRRGFGGAKLHDVTHFADRIILPYRPSAIVLFAGTNDISGQANDKTPEALFADFTELAELIRGELPGTPLYYISMTPIPARREVWPSLREANEAIAKYAQQHPHLHFIDMTDAFLNASDQPRNDLFWWDKVHLNRKGYRIWAGRIRDRML
ncbi:MAG: GDSL-type esterase/lipase family protein [Lewinella sp.]